LITALKSLGITVAGGLLERLMTICICAALQFAKGSFIEEKFIRNLEKVMHL